jgi:hypothetical protein
MVGLADAQFDVHIFSGTAAAYSQTITGAWGNVEASGHLAECDAGCIYDVYSIAREA